MAITQLTQNIILTDEQIQVLNGALLGDGCLYLHKNGRNAQFIYTSKSKQHVEFVSNYFKQYWSGEGIKFYTYFDKRTNKEYSRYVIRTYTNSTFTEIYHKWYDNNGIKHVPRDLILTPLTCLIWYIGDGGIVHNNHSENIKLATQCFSYQDQDFLIKQLQEFEARIMKADVSIVNNQQQYYIYIPHKEEKKFLNFIGPCPFSDYSYKWETKGYKTSIPQSHRNNEQLFCDMYLKGISYYQIAKQFNVEPSVVRYYLVKNRIYKSQNNNIVKNAVVAYDLTNKPIKIYKNATEAGQTTETTISAISNCIAGRRKTANNLIWKKYSKLSEEEKTNIQKNFKEFFKERS